VPWVGSFAPAVYGTRAKMIDAGVVSWSWLIGRHPSCVSSTRHRCKSEAVSSSGPGGDHERTIRSSTQNSMTPSGPAVSVPYFGELRAEEIDGLRRVVEALHLAEIRQEREPP
jgi:hypothetical protein